MGKSEASVSTIAGSSGSKSLRTGAVVKAWTSCFYACSISVVDCHSCFSSDVLLVIGRMILQ